MAHHLGSGVIVLKENHVLLVRDKYGWSFPKGSVEKGETFLKAAERELLEETGLTIKLGDVAFVTEYSSIEYGEYLQFYYSGSLTEWNGTQPIDPDGDVFEIKFVHSKDIKQYMTFRPWVIPLENWLKERITKIYTFDLDAKGFDLV